MHAGFRKIISKNRTEAFLFLFAAVFSSWLMFATFAYSNGNMLIASKAWSDFASHIPLIRSFSFGNNFPIQYPLFAGSPIHYHFLFFLLAGVLEKIGLRIDFALNIPSILGFTFLLLMVYFFAKKIFSSKAVGILSVVFFLFNGSLSFLNFLKQHPLSNSFVSEIISNKSFPSFGPYDQSVVSAFWNLNIYTNQRHLGLSFALSLFIIYIVYFNLSKIKRKTEVSIILGLILGASYLLNIVVFLMSVSVLVCFVFLNIERKNTFILLSIAFIIFFPQYLYFQGENSGFKLLFAPGYLINNNLNLMNFLKYWFMNLGFQPVFFLFGFLIASKKVRLIFISFLSCFLIGNLFQFSPEMAANHKFFNYFMLIASMFSAYFLVFLWKKNIFPKVFILCIIFLLIFSGIIDFFPILNDTKIVLADYKNNPDIAWIMKNTNPKSVFLTTQYLYDSSSIAGRKIYLGWPYFPWSSGYDTQKRSDGIKNFFHETNFFLICSFLKNNHIDYVSLYQPSEDFPFDIVFWENNFKTIYNNKQTSIKIYSQETVCKKI